MITVFLHCILQNALNRELNAKARIISQGGTGICDNGACVSSPCFNMGHCEAVGESFRCLCLPGYTGILCEENINECSSRGKKQFIVRVDYNAPHFVI